MSKLTPEARDAVRSLWTRLTGAYPKAFAVPPVPLKVGIGQDILAAHPDIDPHVLSVVMYRWCGRPSYLKALLRSAVRVDLMGEPAGEVSAEHKDRARDRFKAATEKAARKKAAGKPAPQVQEVPPPVKTPARPVLTLKRRVGAQRGSAA